MHMKGMSTFPEYGFMMLQLRLIILSLMALFFSTVAMALPGPFRAVRTPQYGNGTSI